MKFTYCFLFALCLAACQSERPSTNDQLEEAEQAVRTAFMDLYERYAESDISYTKYYEDSVLRMDGSGDVKYGKQEHVDQQLDVYDRYEVQMLDYSEPTILPGLDQVVTYNTYEEYFIHKERGDTSHVMGTWIAIWRKQDDGSWKLRMTTWHQE